jgi:hypothetical protein
MSEAEEVDALILEIVLPQAYSCIDELISAIGEKNIPKPLLIKCKKLLPSQYPNSFGARS